MKSHSYQVSARELAGIGARVIVPAVLLAGIVRFGAASGLLPGPWPALDVDRTILTHQVNASRTPQDADIVLIGDSSCLMDVSALELDRQFGREHRPINLATSMYTGLGGYASMLSRYGEVNPGRTRLVILLVHPEMLRGIAPPSDYLLFLSDLYAGADPREPGSFYSQVRGLFGLNILENRLLARCPLPLPGEYGRDYGFNLNLYAYMDRERGSASDPHCYVPAPGQGDAEYRLAPALEPEALSFRAAMPPGARLLVGLTPVPESFATAGHAAKSRQILLQWGRWLQADCLSNLPATIPDALFASPTHLNRQGTATYTVLLAKELQSYFGGNPRRD